MTGGHLIEVRNASKAYGGVRALSDVSIHLDRGEILGLAGENGAGKSTLCKALAGAVELSEGEILIDGRPQRLGSPADALRAGIVMVYQETSLVPTMTVAQNIQLGAERPFNRLRVLYRETQAVLSGMNFHVDPTALCGSLGAGQRQMVEIARAIFHDAKLVIFDEPTASLAPAEKKQFFRLLRRLKADGRAVITISHALEEALKVCDRIAVLRDGAHIVTKPAAAFSRQELITHMVGRAVEDSYYGSLMSSRERFIAAGQQAARKLPRTLRVENLCYGGVVRNMSFSARAGEVTGIAGLIGAGRTEAAKVISGVFKRDMINGGRVFLDGKPVRYRTPKHAMRDGIVYVTEDRKLNGYFETMDTARNVYVGWLAAYAGAFSGASGARARGVAQPWLERLHVRSLARDARLVELSGGNQQKVVIAKSLCQKPRVVFFDEPTRGVDVGSIPEIHAFIRALAAEGIVVVVISSYLPEVLSVSDRILVARQGRIVEELPAHEATQDKIMYAAAS
ncbi:sugar ABC transporter ATP-binding protein [Marinibaculum pumilum]|uniref:Sugar ABC transporter ATP-binding protein n=1 Tax=Marinibaculum pumilum TaxID=1766165 RepID=A0ABV7KYF6_9PROT